MPPYKTKSHDNKDLLKMYTLK